MAVLLLYLALAHAQEESYLFLEDPFQTVPVVESEAEIGVIGEPKEEIEVIICDYFERGYDCIPASKFNK